MSLSSNEAQSQYKKQLSADSMKILKDLLNTYFRSN